MIQISTRVVTRSKTLFLPILMILSGLCGCTGSGRGSSEGIDTLDLKGEIIIPYESINQPVEILVTDSKLYLVNSMQVDTLIEEYTLDGKFVRSFLTKGNGPDEVPNIFYIRANPYHKRLDIVKTPNNLEGLNLEGNPTLKHLFTYTQPEGDSGFSPDTILPQLGAETVQLADGSVVAGNMSQGGLLAIFTPDGTFRQFAANYPSKSEYGEGLPDYMIYNFMRPQMVVSPDGRHFAARMGLADYLVFGELTPDSLRLKPALVAPPKGIKVIVGNGWSSFEYDDYHIVPLKHGPVMSADRVYISHNDIPEMEYRTMIKEFKEGVSPAETILTEYDFDGVQVGAVRIDVIPRSLAVSPDGKSFYVLTETDEDGIIVKRYTK